MLLMLCQERDEFVAKCWTVFGLTLKSLIFVIPQISRWIVMIRSDHTTVASFVKVIADRVANE